MRMHRERFADWCTNRVTAFDGGSVVVCGGISFMGKSKACHHWRWFQCRKLSWWDSAISGNPIFPQSRSERYPPRWHGLHPQSKVHQCYLQNLGVEKMELPVLTSTSVNTCGISLNVPFVPEWPTQPHWLTRANAGYRMGCHPPWPSWWPASGVIRLPFWQETNLKQEYLVYHGSLRHSKQEKNQLRLDFTILTNSGGFWKMRITK